MLVDDGRTEDGAPWSIIELDDGMFEVWYDGCVFGGEYETLDEARKAANGTGH